MATIVWSLRREIGHIAGQGIAHLDGPIQFGGPLLQYGGQVLPGVPMSREEQRDPVVPEDRDDSGGEHALAVGAIRVRRFAPMGRAGDRTFIAVSSLWRTWPWAAWRISSSWAGSIDAAKRATISHCVAAGKGMPRLPWSRSRRLNGSPLPYLSSAIMLADSASYFSEPTSGGASAVKIVPHKWQRSFCNS